MHILVIPSSFPSQYAKIRSVFVQDQCVALGKHEDRVGVIAINPITLPSIIKEGLAGLGQQCFHLEKTNVIQNNFVNVPKMSRLNNLRRINKASKAIEKYIAEYGVPDIIHLHNFPAAQVAVNMSEKYQIPMVYTEHSSNFATGNLSTLQSKLAEVAVSNARACIAVSDRFKSLLTKRFKTEFIVIPNMVDTAYFSVIPKRKKVKRILAIGSLDKNKNHIMLLASFRKLLITHPCLVLDIIGDGPEMKVLDNYIVNHNLTGKVNLLGLKNRFEIREHLSLTDVFVSSSKYETFGVVIIEAMSCGIPVVSTRSEGPLSILTDSDFGELSDLNISSLSDKMKYVINNFSNYQPERIRRHVEENFSDSVLFNRLRELYIKVLSEK